MRMLERLAKWYLKRRGVVTLDRYFVGVAIGNASLTKESDCYYGLYPNNPNAMFGIIALNNSIVSHIKG